MSAEIQAMTGLIVKKGQTRLDVAKQIENFDMAGTRVAQFQQTIGTTYEAIAWPADMANQGFAHFRNIDPTNYIELGLVVSATFYPFAKLVGGAIGQPAQFPVGGTLYAKANTASCELSVAGCER
jgi:hypothetical protein